VKINFVTSAVFKSVELQDGFIPLYISEVCLSDRKINTESTPTF